MQDNVAMPVQNNIDGGLNDSLKQLESALI